MGLKDEAEVVGSDVLYISTAAFRAGAGVTDSRSIHGGGHSLGTFYCVATRALEMMRTAPELSV